jgi:hypothetical protein
VTDERDTERARLLDEGNRLIATLRAKDTDPAVAREARDRRDALLDRYLELLSEVTVARSPDSATLVRWRIDTVGLDGWYWRYETAAVDDPDPMPAGWLAMNGAMRLVEPVEINPELVVPGPGMPYVVPRLLRAPGVRAVIAQVAVGRHTGWPITYFGPRPLDTPLVNTWGRAEHYVYDADGTWLGWSDNLERVSDYDFELADWLRSGKLLWIAPGDDSGTLREGVDGCPYLDLPGPRKIARIEDGKVSYGLVP